MQSPSGWVEPGQTPEFDEYTVVLRGMLKVESKEGALEVNAGKAWSRQKENGFATALQDQTVQNILRSAFRPFHLIRFIAILLEAENHSARL